MPCRCCNAFQIIFMHVFMLNQVERTKSHGFRLCRMRSLDSMSSTAHTHCHEICDMTSTFSLFSLLSKCAIQIWEEKCERAFLPE